MEGGVMKKRTEMAGACMAALGGSVIGLVSVLALGPLGLVVWIPTSFAWGWFVGASIEPGKGEQ